MNNKCKVFLFEPTKSNIDLSTALTFGEIEYVFSPGERRCSVFNSAAYCKSVIDKLDQLEFDKDNDYVCAVGSIISVTTAIIAISQVYPNFNLLLFNSLESAYVARQFNRSIWE